jgi:nucleotide-binding universal stress UspA family protein
VSVIDTGYRKLSTVVGVDGSETSWRALYYAIGLAKRQRSRIVAVFVATYPATGDTCAAYAFDAALGMAQRLEPAIREAADEWGVPIEFARVGGDPVLRLLETAQVRSADVLVLGASKSGFRRLGRSKPARAARRSPCPVTIVP